MQHGLLAKTNLRWKPMQMDSDLVLKLESRSRSCGVEFGRGCKARVDYSDTALDSDLDLAVAFDSGFDLDLDFGLLQFWRWL